MVSSQSTTASTAEARQNLAAIINRVAYGRERIVLTRHGRQVAGLVPMSDILRLRELDGQNPMASIQGIPEGASTREHLVKSLERELGLSGE